MDKQDRTVHWLAHDVHMSHEIIQVIRMEFPQGLVTIQPHVLPHFLISHHLLTRGACQH